MISEWLWVSLWLVWLVWLVTSVSVCLYVLIVSSKHPTPWAPWSPQHHDRGDYFWLVIRIKIIAKRHFILDNYSHLQHSNAFLSILVRNLCTETNRALHVLTSHSPVYCQQRPLIAVNYYAMICYISSQVKLSVFSLCVFLCEWLQIYLLWNDKPASIYLCTSSRRPMCLPYWK